MTKEYLRMSTIFPMGVNIRDISNEPNNDICKYAVHAINSHDELVAEIKRLRSINKKFKERLFNAEWHNQNLHKTIDTLQKQS